MILSYNGAEVCSNDEPVATNVYCKCTMTGLSGNIGIYTNEYDGHYTDCFVIDYTIGCLVRGKNNIITNGGFYNNKLMGLRNTLAIKNESICLIVINNFFTNPTGTDRFYEGERDTVTWANNNVDEKEIFGLAQPLSAEK